MKYRLKSVRVIGTYRADRMPEAGGGLPQMVTVESDGTRELPEVVDVVA